MRATDAVADLLRSGVEWRRFFKRCCEASAFRLRSQAWQFRAGLAERGIRADLEDVQAALHVIAGKILPGTPAGEAAAGISDWRDHPLACDCGDCVATMPRHVSATPATEPDAEPTGAERERLTAGAKLAATGVIQAPGQVFELAREHFGGRAERGGAA